MRFNKPVYFLKLTPERYDEITGNYVENVPTKTMKFADVTDAGINTMQVIYGTIKQGAITIRLQQPYIKPFDYVEVDGKRYRADFIRGGRTFICREVQHHG